MAERSSALLDVIRGRSSVRKLLPDPVPPAVLEAAVEAAGWAPSPHGRQPWRFVIVEERTAKIRLAEMMAESWQDQLALDGQQDVVIQTRLRKSQARIIDAPVILIACLYLADLDLYPDPHRQEAERIMAIQSLGAAVQNALLSIHAAGYDAGWMCAPLFAPDVVRQALALPTDLTPHVMLPIGRRADDPVRRLRRPVEQLIARWITEESGK